jgi:Sugar (and other) transporter
LVIRWKVGLWKEQWTIQMSKLPLRLLSKTILLPSGEKAGFSSTVCMGKKGLIRTRSSSTPEGLAVKIWQSPAVEHLAGPVFALVILFVRRTLPESPRWLITHGRQQEAEAALRQIEDLARRSGQSLTPVDDSSAILLVPDKEYG